MTIKMICIDNELSEVDLPDGVKLTVTNLTKIPACQKEVWGNGLITAEVQYNGKKVKPLKLPQDLEIIIDYYKSISPSYISVVKQEILRV